MPEHPPGIDTHLAPDAESFDYLAKDYSSFRRLMFERIEALVPEWRERNPADVGVAIVEVLAYAADYLSYHQDAIANEAYLATARHRASVRKHLRLVGYRLHEGCNSRTWLHLGLGRSMSPSPSIIPARTRVLSRTEGLPPRLEVDSWDNTVALQQGGPVFETMHAVTLHPELNRMELAKPLQRGASSIVFRGWQQNLTQGSALLLDWVAPPTVIRSHVIRVWQPPVSDMGLNAQRLEIPVTYVELSSEQALPFLAKPLDSSGAGVHVRMDPDSQGNAGRIELLREHDAGSRVLALRGRHAGVKKGCVLVIEEVGKDEITKSHVARISEPPVINANKTETRVALFPEDALPFDAVPFEASGACVVGRGNLVLVDHGLTIDVAEILPQVRDPARYRPALPHSDITWSVPLDDERARVTPASVALEQDPWRALPQVELWSRGPIPALDERWQPRLDLLDSGRFARDFVIEPGPGPGNSGTTQLRFGDGLQGRRPSTDLRLELTYRRGSGPAGRIGAGALAHVVLDENIPIEVVRNPFSAAGGERAESVEQARMRGPRSRRRPESLVTAPDYVAAAERDPQVLAAAAHIGRNRLDHLYVQRTHGRLVDERFAASLRARLLSSVLAGRRLQIHGAQIVPVEIELHCTIERGFIRESVRNALLRALGPEVSSDGRRGFFHPHHFRLGETLSIGAVVDAAMRIPGVALARATVFRQWGQPAGQAAVSERIDPGQHAHICLMNRTNSPAEGLLTLVLEGGA